LLEAAHHWRTLGNVAKKRLYDGGRVSAQAALRSEAWQAGQSEAFEAALSGAPLEASLGVLVRTAIEYAGGEARGAFYTTHENGTSLNHVTGMSEAYARCVNGFVVAPHSLAWSRRASETAGDNAGRRPGAVVEALAVACRAVRLPGLLVLPDRDLGKQGGRYVRDVLQGAAPGVAARSGGCRPPYTGRGHPHCALDLHPTVASSRGRRPKRQGRFDRCPDLALSSRWRSMIRTV